MKAKDKPHYVNNAQFSEAVVEYVKHARELESQGLEKPRINDYIASCFLKIAEGLSHKANFVRYTYREEMMMDAVENCLKAIDNYNLETATRTGKPNAFAYFTQISWYAFLRRIEREKKQQEIKMRYLTESGIEDLISEESQNDDAFRQTQAFVDELRGRIDIVKESDKVIKDYEKGQRQKRKRKVDSDLSEFIGEEEEYGMD